MLFSADARRAGASGVAEVRQRLGDADQTWCPPRSPLSVSPRGEAVLHTLNGYRPAQ